MSKHTGPVLGSIAAALLLAGGVAAVQAFQPVEHDQPTRQVELVQPAAETVTVTASPTTTTAAPKPVVKPKPKPVQTVESAPKQTTQQRQAIVSEPTPNTSEPKFGTNPVNGAPNPPPVDRGTNDLPPPPSS